MTTSDTNRIRQAIEVIAPQRFDQRHFDRLCDLDPRLDRLRRQIESGPVPSRMPGYWHCWQSIERRLADIIRRPDHPFLRTRYALNVAHDGLRRQYWESAARRSA